MVQLLIKNSPLKTCLTAISSDKIKETFKRFFEHCYICFNIFKTALERKFKEHLLDPKFKKTNKEKNSKY